LPDDGESRESKKSMLVQLANYSQLAFIFPAATVVGWLIGAALDHWLHTTWLYLAGLIVGSSPVSWNSFALVTSSESKPWPFSTDIFATGGPDQRLTRGTPPVFWIQEVTRERGAKSLMSKNL
jgi:hypothetical protein